MSDRKSGWHHVVTSDGTWNCAMWNGFEWFTTFESYLKDYDFECIGDYIPTPDEPWQCVPEELTNDMSEHGFIDSGYCSGTGSEDKVWKFLLEAAPKPGDS